MPRKRIMARWVGISILLFAAVWGIYELIQVMADSGSEATAGRYILPILAIVLVVLSLALIGLLVRNLVRLIVDRKRGILGSRLRTKLVFFFLGFVLIPALMMVYGSAVVIKRTVEAIVRTPVEEVTRYSREIVDDWNDFLRTRCGDLSTRLGGDVRTGVEAAGWEDGSWLEAWRDGEGLDFVVVSLEGEPPRVALQPALALDPESAARIRNQALDLSSRVRREGQKTAKIEELLDGSLLVHAAAPVPGGEEGAGRRGVVAVGMVHPVDLTSKMRVITKEADSYRRFRLERRDLVRLYLMLIFLILVVTLFIATWVGFYLGRRITEPIEEVADAAREISAGNLDVRVKTRTGDEVGMLVDSFNEMAAQLQESREVISRSTADLRRSNLALDERRRYIETLVANLSTAVISLDNRGRVTTSNPAVKTILGVEPEVGTDILRSMESQELAPLAELLSGVLSAGSGEIRRDLVLPREAGSRVVSAQVSTLLGGRGESLGTLVMVEDLTDLVSAQRAAAWREVARRIAHEIKNPLTPIQLAAQRLRKKFQEDSTDLSQVVPEATGSIEREVMGLKNLVDEFSHFARMPEASPRAVDIRELVRSLAALYEGRAGLSLVVDAQPDIGIVEIDPEQLRRAVINLIENALEAMNGEGSVTIRLLREPETGVLRIEVADTGPGVPPTDRDKMFVPYYSNKPSGTGLGLAIVHRIVTEHHGTIRVEDNEPTGARFVIEIPA